MNRTEETIVKFPKLALLLARGRDLKLVLLNLLRDSHTIPWNCPKPSFATLVWRTVRYRATSRNVFLAENEKRIAAYKDYHKGERAFILGNGPSLNRCDLTLLRNEVVFGVNGIFLNYEKMGFYPTYYVVEDVFVAEDRDKQINSYHGPVKFFGNYLRYCLEDSDRTLWLNVRFCYDDYPGFPHFSRDALRNVWTGGTVSYLCMQLAYYMGFSEVYLVGFDHSYTIPEDAKKTGPEILSTSDDPNHFHPDYFGKGYRWHDPMVERMELAYKRAKQAYESAGKMIYNATEGGNLKVFERVTYKDLF
jgi:hypothetical protein